MQRRLHIFGASGSGTTSLGGALAKALRCRHFDADTYFWQRTDPPFTRMNEPRQRADLLRDALRGHSNWVLSGSICGWGDEFRDEFTLAVFLWIPAALRMQRLRERDRRRFGARIAAGGDMHAQHREFLDWAARYDDAGPDMRSRVLHETWLSTLACPVLRIEYDASVAQWCQTTLARLDPAVGRFGE
jgi:adenylate kinase family enzyme